MICGGHRRYRACRNFVRSLTLLIDCGGLGGATSPGSAASKTHHNRIVELRRGLRDGLLNRGGGEDRSLFDAEGELVAFDDVALARLSDTLLFSGTLANDLGGMIVFEIGCFEVLDTNPKLLIARQW